MPIVNKSDIVEYDIHPIIHRMNNSNSTGIVHDEIGNVFIVNNEWFIHFIEQLETIVDSTLARRLAHSSLSYWSKIDYSKWSPKRGLFRKSSIKQITQSFEKWANDRIILGRGIVTPVNWPYSFHIERPLMVSLEVGEICSFLQYLHGKSLRYQWRDDGGSNASITFEEINFPINQGEIISIEDGFPSEFTLNIDNGIGWPTRDGLAICVIPTKVFFEFYDTLKELPIQKIDDPLIESNELVNEIDHIVCMASLNACSRENQRYLIDDYNQFKNWFDNKIESNGFGKFISATDFDSDLTINFKAHVPWPIITGIILDAWQRNNGMLGLICVKSVNDNNILFSIKSRREIA